MHPARAAPKHMLYLLALSRFIMATSTSAAARGGIGARMQVGAKMQTAEQRKKECGLVLLEETRLALVIVSCAARKPLPLLSTTDKEACRGPGSARVREVEEVGAIVAGSGPG